MIIQEQINGFTHTFSDNNKMIIKVGTEDFYSEAFDVIKFEYEETEIDIENTLDVTE